MPSLSRRTTLVAVVVLVGALVCAAALWWSARPASELERASRFAPSDTQRMAWTDWSRVRDEVGDPSDVADLMRAGEDADLVSTSALASSAEALDTGLGISPLTLRWELLAQGPEGAALLLRLPDDTEAAEVGERLEGLGYSRPEREDGVWDGGADVAANAGLSPQFQYVAVLGDESLLVASDTQAYAETAARTVRGDVASADGLDPLVDAAAGSASAFVFTGEYVCRELALAQADPEAHAEGEALIEQAGGLHPLAGFALAADSGRDVRAVMLFEDNRQADEDLEARASLASGPAVGQGGGFAERFRLRGAEANGPLVTLDLSRAEGAYVLSDLSSGPVLFASC